VSKHNLCLTESEVIELLEAARKGSIHDHALLSTIYELALRSSEATALKREDVSFTRNYVSVKALKRSKEKRDKDTGKITRARKPPPIYDVPVSPELLGILRTHIDRSPKSEWLFPHHKDSSLPMTRSRAKYTYYKAATKIGLGRRYDWHPHLLRIAKATHKSQWLAEQNTAPLEAVSEIQDTLRHATTTMAFEYVKATSKTRELGRQADAALASRILGKKKPSDAPVEKSAVPADANKDGTP